MVHKRESSWWVLVCVALGATALNFPIVISGGFDLGEIVYLFLGVPVVSLVVAIVVLIAALRRKRAPSVSVFLSFPVYWVISWMLFANVHPIRDHYRWLLESKRYKAELFAQPEPGDDELRHIDWDGWGWAGMDTNVYIVFDPSDSLAAAARSHAAGKFKGVPCEVPRVRRLERDWYSVEFYTDTGWGQCA